MVRENGGTGGAGATNSQDANVVISLDLNHLLGAKKENFGSWKQLVKAQLRQHATFPAPRRCHRLSGWYGAGFDTANDDAFRGQQDGSVSQCSRALVKNLRYLRGS